jgi:enoyl-CoA hydratase/carnithine racemase
MKSPTEAILVELKDNTAYLTINNPPANTWTKESLNGLEEIINELNENDNIYSLIITGSGDRFFSAGADLNMFVGIDKDYASILAKAFNDAFYTLSHFKGLSVAAINGFAMGGGLECALACDLRVAEKQSVVGLPEARVGLLPCGGGTQNLTTLVGQSWAKRMILCGEKIDAQTGVDIGLIDIICDQGNALTKATELAQKVSQQSPIAVNYCKSLIQGRRDTPLQDMYKKECSLFTELFETEDQKEGVRAFLEKRDPEWKNA